LIRTFRDRETKAIFEGDAWDVEIEDDH